ncbi:MAG: hypothetical protein WC865_12170 [Bacteroidales bacterium]
MEDASSLPVTDPVNPGKSRRRQQLTILIACVLIATVLWFLRALENEYTTRVDHPVRYINLPDKMIILNPLPQRISLEVKGLGFSVLRHNWNFSKTPLTIDIKKLKSVPAKRKKGFVEYMPMNQYFNDFPTQLKDLKVLAIIPDTLMFRFAFKKTRNIKVIPAFVYESGSSHIPDSLVRINPDSIEVEGPDLILDTLRSIRTLPIRLNRPSASFSRSLGLEEIHNLVKIKPAKVTVSIGKKP